MKPYYENPESWLDPFIELFIAEDIDFALIGGMAAMRYRLHLRHTVDLDFVINKLGNLLDKFDERGFIYRVLNEYGTSNPYLVQGQTTDGMHFDIYVASVTFEDSVLERKIEGQATREDVLIYKLIAWRPQDRDDVAEILATEAPLDMEYLNYWADQWGIERNLKEALDNQKAAKATRANGPDL